ncbi:GIY-YIG nuclease family protein [Parasphingorhabdus cellanae]|uniref:GIY-YIG nuclease family protein n=1 Tax=Parasphingorhabdus cellanae TaxID=2806553 RepID=UPI002873E2AC|nr:GIY-YIG nuclease family protein [Parasphingorhabdus cellanae]
MTNQARRPVYIGVTVNVAERVYQHRQGKGSAYCKRYNLTRLVHIEEYPTMIEAITREKAMKAWKRPWKDTS